MVGGESSPVDHGWVLWVTTDLDNDLVDVSRVLMGGWESHDWSVVDSGSFDMCSDMCSEPRLRINIILLD